MNDLQPNALFLVPSGPPLDVRVEAKSSTELIVSWEPPQRDLWNGNILGYYVGFQEVSDELFSSCIDALLSDNNNTFVLLDFMM